MIKTQKMSCLPLPVILSAQTFLYPYVILTSKFKDQPVIFFKKRSLSLWNWTINSENHQELKNLWLPMSYVWNLPQIYPVCVCMSLLPLVNLIKKRDKYIRTANTRNQGPVLYHSREFSILCSHRVVPRLYYPVCRTCLLILY